MGRELSVRLSKINVSEMKKNHRVLLRAANKGTQQVIRIQPHILLLVHNIIVKQMELFI